jgi:hypothetical protein
MPTVPGQRNDFGPLVVETDVDTAVIKLLRKWLPTYLSILEDERELEAHTLARPKPESYTNTIDEDEFLDHRLPAVIVTTARTVGAPTRLGDGIYATTWAVTVSSVVRGRTPSETRWVASLFGGSVRRALTHNMDLETDGAVNGIRWLSSEPISLADDTGEGRFLAALVNTFTVSTDAALQDARGPVPSGPYDSPDPVNDPDIPYDPPLDVAEVNVAVEGVPITATPGDD